MPRSGASWAPSTATTVGGRAWPTSGWPWRTARHAACTLNPGQAALVPEMATCGRRVALALAPAGTGKTTAMAAVSRAWRSSDGRVIGLAPTADAAIALGEDLGAITDTLDKYVWSADPATASMFGYPDWFNTVGPDTLIVLDEAGKAATAGLDAMIADAL